MSNTGAILQVLLFLGTVALLGLGVLVAVWALVTGRELVGKRVLLGCAVVAGAYLGMLLLASALSRRKLVTVASEKYFCELDCHLAYSVKSVWAVGAGGQETNDTLVVLVQTRFDETTISPSRSRTAPTWPAPRVVELLDADGTHYQPLDNVEPLMSRLGIASTPITRELAPGQSYVTAFAFEVPPGAPEPALVLADDLVVSRFLIGHERSFLHAPVLLALPEASMPHG
jgi:hypothetical protein